MSSVEDELGLARPLVRVLNQAALAEFMAGELAEVSPNATLGGPRRDALIAALEASAAAARELAEAFNVVDRQRAGNKA